MREMFLCLEMFIHNNIVECYVYDDFGFEERNRLSLVYTCSNMYTKIINDFLNCEHQPLTFMTKRWNFQPFRTVEDTKKSNLNCNHDDSDMATSIMVLIIIACICMMITFPSYERNGKRVIVITVYHQIPPVHLIQLHYLWIYFKSYIILAHVRWILLLRYISVFNHVRHTGCALGILPIISFILLFQ